MARRVHWISERSQLLALINPVLHEIIDRLTALGPLSARELALALGRKQTAVYQHLRTLERVGLILKYSSRSSVAGRSCTPPSQHWCALPGHRESRPIDRSWQKWLQPSRRRPRETMPGASNRQTGSYMARPAITGSFA